LLNLAAVALSYATYASAAIHTVHVGDGGLTFEPATTTAEVNDIINFMFHGNHTATRSSFDSPCTKLTGNGTFSSGVLHNGSYFNVTVQDASPIWIYCGVATHCESGMVAAVNPPTSGNRTYEAFKAKAKAFVPPNVTTTTSATGTGASASPTSSKKGAGVLRYSTGLSAICAVAVAGALGLVTL